MQARKTANNYSAPVLEHAQSPHHRGPLAQFNGHAQITGSCGDTMHIWIQVQDDRVEEIGFETDGCIPSVACGSMAASLAQGKRLEEVRSLGAGEILNALGGLPETEEHCALLAETALRAACEDYLGQDRSARPETAPRAESSCETCSDASCSASRPQPDETPKDFEERRKLMARLCRIRKKILVLSGKGGVGKSTVAVNLAMALQNAGKCTGLLDVDIHGPSVPTLLGIEDARILWNGEDLIPVEVEGVKVLSLGFFLGNQDDAVIWRGPLKMGVIKQFLKDGAWGDLDVLVVDSPPGTGDEPLSVCQLLGKVDGAIIVTTPQKVAAVDVRKSVSFCRQLRVPVIGVVENMSGFACPHCGKVTPILRSGGGRHLAEDMRVPFLGSIPMDPKIAEYGDMGQTFVNPHYDSPAARVIRDIVTAVEALDGPDNTVKHH